jgi:glycerol-3-phosphate dehydrogenase
MSRLDTIQDLRARAQEPWDLIVIGGGATGLGVGLNAALRGFSVLVLESRDFASGTSSRATKLLHGGVRYLAQGNVHLVREALHERATIMAIAPHLAQPLPFVMPSYTRWATPFYGLGLKLYDLLAGRKSLGPTRLLNRAQTEAALPGVQTQGLHGGVQYWDGQFDDARLALTLAKTIQREGGRALNYMRVDDIARAAGSPSTERFKVRAVDERSGEVFQLQTRAVVNATGVWVDALRRLATPSGDSHLVSPSQGVHVVVKRDFMPGHQALLVPKTQDGRVLFAVPWLGSLILGTTDTPRTDLPHEPRPFDEELNFIFTEASRALSRPVTRADVQSVWVGLRPLVAVDHHGQTTKTLSREHTIVQDANGLITVTGGKWTTYRVMAEDTMQTCFRSGLLPSRPTRGSETLVGAPPEARSLPITDAPGLHLYGTEQAEVLRLPGADRPLGLGLTEAMVRYAARQEWALTVEDVLARRWRVLFLDARLAQRMAKPVAKLLREETGQDPGLENFLALARHYALVD